MGAGGLVVRQHPVLYGEAVMLCQRKYELEDHSTQVTLALKHQASFLNSS
jgi:hypothetical protein